MKKTLFSSIIFTLFTAFLFAQTPAGYITIKNQSDFAQFSNSTKLQGVVQISGPGITSLAPLSNLEEVEGMFMITSTNITNLNGLQNLKKVTNLLSIANNQKLTDISQLNGLQNVGKRVKIDYNHALKKIEGLTSLTNVDGTVEISQNHGMTELKLEGLTAVTGSFNLYHNYKLTSVSIPALNAIGGNLDINNNPVLEDCCVFIPFLNGSSKLKGNLVLNGNKPKCATETAINNACKTSSGAISMNCTNSKTGAKITFMSKTGKTIQLKVDWDEGSTFSSAALNITNGKCVTCKRVGGLGRPHGKEAVYTIEQTNASKPVIIKWTSTGFCGNASITIPN